LGQVALRQEVFCHRAILETIQFLRTQLQKAVDTALTTTQTVVTVVLVAAVLKMLVVVAHQHKHPVLGIQDTETQVALVALTLQVVGAVVVAQVVLVKPITLAEQVVLERQTVLLAHQ
jgi:hypothetical protein